MPKIKSQRLEGGSSHAATQLRSVTTRTRPM